MSHEAISDQHFDIAEQMKETGEASDTPDETLTGSSAVRIKLNPKARKVGRPKLNKKKTVANDRTDRKWFEASESGRKIAGDATLDSVL
ncbi:Cysteine protease [Phytophthora megakarya]|uniref:Cysteine protease n=1 Tax=Phytophthora megakarya TaxID=4795 RepID=A0A225UIW5_9STRA|nr:Cysteine protease [Phytophthora megakarya]